MLLVYAAASLLRFAHNAEFLAGYPSLPGWLSRGGVYAAWVTVTGLGVIGYALAPASAHTTAMNATIGLEVVTAALLLAVLAIRVGRAYTASRT